MVATTTQSTQTLTPEQQMLEDLLQFGLDNAYGEGGPLIVPSLPVGSYTAQGDVNFWSLAKLPKGCTKVEKPEQQLAPGNTPGSRHCVAYADMGKVTFWSVSNRNVIVGVVLEFTANEPITINHPEHRDQTIFPPEKGFLGVSFQVRHAEELKRLAD